METRNITCVVCPKGCSIKVNMDDGRIAELTGNSCNKGEEYAAAECTSPVRTLTTTVRITGGCYPVAPVKSEKPLPKDLLLKCVDEINKCTLKAPVRIGEVVAEDILGTGVNIVITGNISAEK